MKPLLRGVTFTRDNFWSVVSGNTTYLCIPIKVPSHYRKGKQTECQITFNYGRSKIRRMNRFLPGQTVYVREPIHIQFRKTDDPGRRYDTRVVYRYNLKKSSCGNYTPWIDGAHMRVEFSRVFLSVIETRIKRIKDLTYADAFCLGFKDIKSFVRQWDRKHGDNQFSDNPWVYIVRFKVQRTNKISNSRIRLMTDGYE